MRSLTMIATIVMSAMGCGVYQNMAVNTALSRNYVAGSEAVFVVKQGCGFLDLGKDVVVTGTAVRVADSHGDGDWSIVLEHITSAVYLINNEPVDVLKPWIDHPAAPHIKAEFMPRENRRLDVRKSLLEAKRMCIGEGQDIHRGGKFQCVAPFVVTIWGRLAWDGVDHAGEFVKEQIPRCIEGRPPTKDIGWVEIHPATNLAIAGIEITPMTNEQVLEYMSREWEEQQEEAE